LTNEEGAVEYESTAASKSVEPGGDSGAVFVVTDRRVVFAVGNSSSDDRLIDHVSPVGLRQIDEVTTSEDSNGRWIEVAVDDGSAWRYTVADEDRLRIGNIAQFIEDQSTTGALPAEDDDFGTVEPDDAAGVDSDTAALDAEGSDEKADEQTDAVVKAVKDSDWETSLFEADDEPDVTDTEDEPAVGVDVEGTTPEQDHSESGDTEPTAPDESVAPMDGASDDSSGTDSADVSGLGEAETPESEQAEEDGRSDATIDEKSQPETDRADDDFATGDSGSQTVSDTVVNRGVTALPAQILRRIQRNVMALVGDTETTTDSNRTDSVDHVTATAAFRRGTDPGQVAGAGETAEASATPEEATEEADDTVADLETRIPTAGASDVSGQAAAGAGGETRAIGHLGTSSLADHLADGEEVKHLLANDDGCVEYVAEDCKRNRPGPDCSAVLAVTYRRVVLAVGNCRSEAATTDRVSTLSFDELGGVERASEDGTDWVVLEAEDATWRYAFDDEVAAANALDYLHSRITETVQTPEADRPEPRYDESVDDYLASSSLAAHLRDDEAVRHVLTNETGGMQYFSETAQERVEPGPWSGAVMAVTDSRIVFGVGNSERNEETTDRVFTVRFEEITEVDSTAGMAHDRLTVTTDDGRKWYYFVNETNLVKLRVVKRHIKEIAGAFTAAEDCIDHVERAVSEVHTLAEQGKWQQVEQQYLAAREKIEETCSRTTFDDYEETAHLEARVEEAEVDLEQAFVAEVLGFAVDRLSNGVVDAHDGNFEAAHEAFVAARKCHDVAEKHAAEYAAVAESNADAFGEVRRGLAQLAHAPLEHARTLKERAEETDRLGEKISYWESVLEGYETLVSLDWEREATRFELADGRLAADRLDAVESYVETLREVARRRRNQAHNLFESGEPAAAYDRFGQASQQLTRALELTEEFDVGDPERIEGDLAIVEKWVEDAEVTASETQINTIISP
jgi:hypothetical protein